MHNLVKFILVGLFFGLTGEFLINFFITNMAGIITVVFYLVFLVFVYYSGRIIDRVFEKRIIANVIYYLVFGLIGLAIEWFLLGNSPWANPNANQLGMFSFWVSVSLMPRIFLREGLEKLKKSILVYFIAYITVSILLGFLNPFFVLLVFSPGYFLLNIFYIWYFVKDNGS